MQKHLPFQVPTPHATQPSIELSNSDNHFRKMMCSVTHRIPKNRLSAFVFVNAIFLSVLSPGHRSNCSLQHVPNLHQYTLRYVLRASRTLLPTQPVHSHLSDQPPNDRKADTNKLAYISCRSGRKPPLLARQPSVQDS